MTSDLVDVIEQFTWELYQELVDLWGEPANKLKQVITGNLNYNRDNEPVWALCEQVLHKSHISYDSELFLEKQKFIVGIVCHELAHVFAGNDEGHNEIFELFLKKIKKVVDENYY